MDLLVATDYRGLVDSMAAERGGNAESLRHLPLFRSFSNRPALSASQRVLVWIVGALFGIAGPAGLTLGIVALARRPWRFPAIDAHPT